MWTWAEPGVSNAFASVPPSLRVYTPIQDGRSNPSFIAFPLRSTVGISATFFTKKAPISNMCCISCNGFRWDFHKIPYQRRNMQLFQRFAAISDKIVVQNETLEEGA
jgi:hypothetical protein